MWTYILEESVRVGMNTIILDIGGGIEFGSHPEIATKGAWRRSRVRQEVKRCKELGIALIPRLNFLLDCVSDTGVKPWIWSCPLFRSTEGYQANVGVDDAVISPWMYHGIEREHWVPITFW